MINIIAAVSLNDVIGNNGSLPWPKIKEDMRYFRRVTIGNTVVMGRKTFESIGSKPLKNRINVVISRQKNYNPDGVTVLNDPYDMLWISQQGKNVFVIGGAELYNYFMPYANNLYVTRIYHYFKGDTFFPTINKMKWEIKTSQPFFKSEENPYDLSFLVYGRV